MNNILNLNNIVIFTVGAAIGSVVTWKLVKTKYEQIAKEEIESVKAVFSKRDPSTITPDKNVEGSINIAVGELKEDQEEYFRTLDECNYKNYSEAKEVADLNKPYVIAPEEFGECEYETVSLTYYKDGVLTDDQNYIVEDVDFVIGRDSLNHFGEYEDDSVFVRNDELKADYEILLDLRNYSDVAKADPHLAEGE